MQTITKEGVSLYTFADDVTLAVTEKSITTPDFIIGDCNNTNSVVYQGVTPPSDWAGGKYLFDGAAWELNPAWVAPIDPSVAERERIQKERQAAYRTESDPIFFMAQRGEATMAEWEAKVAEIKARYPYPTEGVQA